LESALEMGFDDVLEILGGLRDVKDFGRQIFARNQFELEKNLSHLEIQTSFSQTSLKHFTLSQLELCQTSIEFQPIFSQPPTEYQSNF
jgi:hypothetical protein